MSKQIKRRRVRFNNFDDLRGEVTRLSTCKYDCAGNWNLGQVCEHLAITYEASIDGYPDTAPRSVQRVARILLPLIFATRRIQRGMKIPSHYTAAPDIDQNRAVDRFLSAIARVEVHDGEFSPHPFLGAMSPAQWRKLHLIHAEHHFGFLSPVK